MKRLLLMVSIIALVFGATSCGIQTRQDKVLSSLGKYDSKQVWTHGEFQDYTDFGKYFYISVSIDQNNYFQKVTSTDTETICSFIDNFEDWIDTFRNNDPKDELVLNYSFDRSIIDTEDFFYIYEGENYPQFGCYDVWFFDSQTKILYYFHNNI